MIILGKTRLVLDTLIGHIARIALIGVACVAFVGCNSGASDPVATPVLTPLSVFDLSGCTTDALSQWLGYSSTNAQGFIDLLNSSANVAPNDVQELSRKLSAYRGVLAAQIIPKCVNNDSALVFTMMDSAQYGLTDFQIRRTPNLNTVLATANAQYKLILQDQVLLRAQLNLLYAQQKH